MKLRLSNRIDWAAEFAAHDAKSLEAGCRWAWRKYGFTGNLYLHVWAGEWSTSGQYTLTGKHNLPPRDHEISKSAAKNDWAGLWLAVTLSHKHATQINSLIEWVDEMPKPEDRRKLFRVIKDD